MALTFATSPEVERVVVENPVLAEMHEKFDCPDEFSVREMNPDLIAIGPEKPLIAGFADALTESGYLVFGAGEYQAQAEGSKHWAGMFNERGGIVQPPYATFHSYNAAAYHARGRHAHGYVIKADGVAAGKGVTLPSTIGESLEVLNELFVEGKYGGAGEKTTLIADRYHGPEASAFVVSDGLEFVILPLSQDHKRLKDGDQEGAKNPNTGGMGAYSPVPESVVNKDQFGKIQEMAEKFMAQMEVEGHPYRGVLYMGLMMAEETDGDPVAIEYNVRFGDPEAQAVLPLLEKAGIDVYQLFKSAAEGELAYSQSEIDSAIANHPQSALTVCLASLGYPASSHKGDTINGLDRSYEDVIIHYAGVQKGEDGTIETGGGRVLYVTGLGETVDDAADRAYAAIGANAIHFEGMQYRKEIGKQARGMRTPEF
ncbi:MAG: phosphoribosylamine--glycine ligase [bacterium]|nr:phosphoribosylamine--glycine ligase [bacterium]